MNTLEQINNNFEYFSKSEKKVANSILESLQKAIHLCIASLAKLANVSEPPVNRFCRRIDTKGFPDFQLRLAQSLVNGASYVNRLVDQDNTVNCHTQKVFDSAIALLGIVKDNLNTTNINRAIHLLTQANKIAFFGLAASAAVTHRVMSKFFRFYIPALYFVDVMMQHIYCINYRYGNVVICILPTGRTQNLVEQAKVAKANDAIIITITTANSSLAQIASLSIAITVPEYTNIYMPMVSRLAQLTLIDVLATGFILRRGQNFRDNLKRVKDILHDVYPDKL